MAHKENLTAAETCLFKNVHPEKRANGAYGILHFGTITRNGVRCALPTYQYQTAFLADRVSGGSISERMAIWDEFAEAFLIQAQEHSKDSCAGRGQISWDLGPPSA